MDKLSATNANSSLLSQGSQGATSERKEAKKQEWKDPNDDVKYVCHGGKVQCKYCNPPIANLIVTTETIMLQDKPWATVGDKDGKINFGFMGLCMHPSQQKPLSPPPPCKSVISLGQWKDFSETMIGNHNALLVKSTIPCMISGEDLKIIHSGQMATLTQVSPIERRESTSVTLTLTKVAFNTKFDICSDGVEEFDDYKCFWILEDKGSYYQWLLERSNPEDSQKPQNIPITFSSMDKVSFKATFKVTSENDFRSAPSIRVTDKGSNYEFNVVSAKTSEEFEISFTSTNTPFAGKVGCEEKFDLLFEYSQDGGKTWEAAGTSTNTLYVTWKTPLYDDYYDTDVEDIITIKVKNEENKDKDTILETLLWLGCSSAKDEVDEGNIIDAIFKPFTTKKVVRAREGQGCYAKDWINEGLGYWRGASALDTPTEAGNFNELRSIRYLLREGEACCGEWAAFLLHLLLSQGIHTSKELDSIGICTDFAYDDWGFDYSITSQFKKADVESSYFTIIDAKYTLIGDKIEIEGKSAAQGNIDARPYFSDHIWVFLKQKIFYDPSYGISYSAQESNLIKYSKDLITSVLVDAGDEDIIEYNNTHIYLRSSHEMVY